MTVAQSGYDQGYQAVKTVVAHLNGEKVESFVDCGTKVIDSTTAEEYMATLKTQMDGRTLPHNEHSGSIFAENAPQPRPCASVETVENFVFPTICVLTSRKTRTSESSHAETFSLLKV